MTTVAILNPHSAGGRTGKNAGQIATKLAEALGPVTIRVTSGPLDATRLTAAALREGADQIIAVGGDGTLNEVVNGFFEDGAPINPEAVLGFVMTGTGGDFRKTFGIGEGLEAGIARLGHAALRKVDVGRITFVGWQSEHRARHFLNIASFGLSGAVVARVNRARVWKLLGGKGTFAFASLAALVTDKAKHVRLKVDNVYDEVVAVSTVAICNGQYFGGGMRMAPGAAPDDGVFDVVILHDVPKRTMFSSLREIYAGTHIARETVTVLQGQRIIAAPVADNLGGPVLLDVDGEGPGQLPATFELLPHALTLRV